MNGGGASAPGDRDVKGVAQNVERSIVGEIRLSENVLQVRCPQTSNPRIVQDIVRIIHGKEPQMDRAVVEPTICQHQHEQDEGMKWPGGSNPARFAGGSLRATGGFNCRFSFHWVGADTARIARSLPAIER